MAGTDDAPGGRAREREVERAALEALLSHVPLGIVIAEAPSGRVLRMSPEAERLLDVREADPMDAHGAYRGFHADGRVYEAHEWPAARSLRSGETVRGEKIELELADGTRRVVAVTSAPVTRDGTTVAVVAVLVDVTENERRERAEREFVANAAHELQTPIAAIMSAIDVLQAGAKERTAERDRFLGHIERATIRLSRLMHALLVLARAETRQEAPRSEVIRLEPFLRGIASSLAAAEVTVDCGPDVAVLANRPLLEQALVNLGENAAKYSDGEFALTAARAGDRVAIAVRDSGPGIPPAARGRVFERFYRGDTDGEGFGLGLAIVRGAVDALGGELRVETGSRGTSVSILLPGARLRRS